MDTTDILMVFILVMLLVLSIAYIYIAREDLEGCKAVIKYYLGKR